MAGSLEESNEVGAENGQYIEVDLPPYTNMFQIGKLTTGEYGLRVVAHHYVYRPLLDGSMEMVTEMTYSNKVTIHLVGVG